MMDHKTWLWRKKSTEKVIVASENLDHSSTKHEREIQTLMHEKAELENDLKTLTEKLSSADSECNNKDEIAKKHEKMAHDASAGWENTKADLVLVRQELDKALHQRNAGEERISQLDAALKECMQQLRFVREEQEKRIHDAVMKVTKEFEKSKMIFDENLAETEKRFAKLGVENSHLSKALLAKEKLIEDLTKQKSQLEADFAKLMARLDSTEKDCTSLTYEIRVLEKDLEIRNEEREFNRREAEALHKQHLESVKKIAKLESECQRLRVLVRKRLPGPAALAKMKNEVDILGREQVDMRRRTNSIPNSFTMDPATDSSPDSPRNKINFLTEQLCALDEENKNLKDALSKKIHELQFSRTMYARAASKLSEIESQLEDSSKDQKILKPPGSSAVSQQFSLASLSDIASDDKVSCAELWASALITESEHFRSGSQRESPSRKTTRASDISLMDDFVEMEKLATVSVSGPSESEFSGNLSDRKGGEIPLEHDNSSALDLKKQELKSKDVSNSDVPSWLQDILKVVMEQQRTTQKDPLEILEDARVALAHGSHPCLDESIDESEKSSSEVTNLETSLAEKSIQQPEPDLSKSLHKIIDLIEGISFPVPDYGITGKQSENGTSFIAYKNAETPSGYTVRVFKWKTSEISPVLLQVVQVCNEVLNGKADAKRFAEEVALALEWIMNHCFSLQDVSSKKDAIKKQFDWDEAQSESEVEVGSLSQLAEHGTSNLPTEQLSATSHGHIGSSKKENAPQNVREEINKLRDDLVNAEEERKDAEGRLQSSVAKTKHSSNQLEDSGKTIDILQKELETLKESRGVIDSQTVNHQSTNDDHGSRLTAGKEQLNEAPEKILSLEAELEDKYRGCEELEANCLDMPEPERLENRETTRTVPKAEEKQLRSESEITAASEKLAECQEAILNLGKQLKALAAPKDAALFDKVISIPSKEVSTTDISTTAIVPYQPESKLNHQRSSLLDQMIAEDHAKGKDTESPDTRGTNDITDSTFILNGSKQYLDDKFVANALAIVPMKKGKEVSLWRKLLWRKRRSISKKTPFPYAP